MRIRRFLGGGAAATVLGLLLATPVAAFDLDGGCTVTLTSMDAAGGTIDTASGPGSGGTSSDPFLIDWEGSISWESSSGEQVFQDHSWQTFVYMIPTPVRGGHPNDGEETTGTGTAGVGENAPFKITGLYFVSGDINGDGGTHCDGSGWFKLRGDATATVPFFVALLFVLAGVALLFASRPSMIVGGTR